MWKQLLELAQQVLTLAKDMQRTQGDVKESKEQILALKLLVQDLINKMEMIAQQEGNEREKFTLKMEMIAQQEKNAREKFELQIRMELAAHFQAEMAKFAGQYAQTQRVEYIGQLPKQLDGVQSIAKLKDPTQD